MCIVEREEYLRRQGLHRPVVVVIRACSESFGACDAGEHPLRGGGIRGNGGERKGIDEILWLDNGQTGTTAPAQAG